MPSPNSPFHRNTATVDKIAEMRSRYVGKVVRYRADHRDTGIVGIVTRIDTQHDRFVEHWGGDSGSTVLLTVDITVRDNEEPYNYWLKPDYITVWGEA